MSELKLTLKDDSNCAEIDVETNSDSPKPLSISESMGIPAKKKTPSECSHKVIEKRRRDRINKCLADLGHIVPKAQGSGKLEKAEVLELTVEYIKKLQSSNVNANSGTSTMSRTNTEGQNVQEKEQPTSCTKRELQSYSKGYSDCTNEVLHFMVTVEATDPQLPCFQRLMAHLRNNCRLLVDFENTKKEHHKSSSVASQKQHGPHKRSFSNGEGQNGGPKTKRSREKAENSQTSNLTNGNGNDEPKPPPSTSGMTLDDKMKAAFKNGNGEKGNPTSNLASAYTNNLFPMGNHGYHTPYGLPAYALYPAGTHYVPVPLHPGMQMPGMPGMQMPGMPGMPGSNFGGSILPAPIVAPGLGYLGSHMPGMQTLPTVPTLPMGCLSNPFGGLVPPYMPMGGTGVVTSSKGHEELPAYLAQEAKSKERNRERVQDSSGSSENDSSGDEYNFSTTSSSNLSEVGIRTDHPIDHSDYFSAGSR